MKTRKITINLPLICVAIIAIVLFVVGTQLDLEISENVSNQSGFFGVLFTAIGNMPSIYFAIFGGAALIFAKTKTEIGRILARVAGPLDIAVCALLLYVSSSDYAKMPTTEAHETMYKLILLAFILAMIGLIIFLTYKLSKKANQENLIRVAILIICIVACYSLFTEIIKYLASRPRPNLVFNGEEAFREWHDWEPLLGFKNSDCKSFVSGHTANAACLMTILPLFISLTKLGTKKYSHIIAFIIGALFTFVVALSRLLAGAHFLTDIMGGILVSIFFQALVIRVAPLILNKIEKLFTK